MGEYFQRHILKYLTYYPLITAQAASTKGKFLEKVKKY